MRNQEIVIQLRLPAAPHRRWLLALCALLLAAGAIAYANVPNVFNQGDPLSASKMNANFTHLDARLTALEVPSTPTFTEQESDMSQIGAYATPLIYENIKLVLSPGTWLVNAFATAYTTGARDTVVLGLYDATAGSEIAQSRGAIADTQSINAITRLHTSKIITLNAAHTIQI